MAVATKKDAAGIGKSGDFYLSSRHGRQTREKGSALLCYWASDAAHKVLNKLH